MKPSCNKCLTDDPDPVTDENGNEIYWFVVDTDDFGDIEVATHGLDVFGDIVPMFQGIPEKEFDYDGGITILCPDCAIECIEKDEDCSSEDNNIDEDTMDDIDNDY